MFKKIKLWNAAQYLDVEVKKRKAVSDIERVFRKKYSIVKQYVVLISQKMDFQKTII